MSKFYFISMMSSNAVNDAHAVIFDDSLESSHFSSVDIIRTFEYIDTETTLSDLKLRIFVIFF